MSNHLFCPLGASRFAQRRCVHAEKGLSGHDVRVDDAQGTSKTEAVQDALFGSGTALMRYVIKNEHVKMVPEWIAEARAAGVRFVGCTMSVDVMGIAKEELLEGVELGGVASFLNAVEGANMTLFI